MAEEKKTQLTYADAGVDIDAGNRAVELMKNNDRITVSEIAYQTGFSDPAYFSRCFKNIYGMTPSQYKDTKLNRF